MEGNRRVVCLTVLLMALFQAAVQQQLSLSSEEEIKKAADNFLVRCTLHNSTIENPKLEWYSPNNKLMTIGPKVIIRKVPPRSSKLILKNLSISDAGVYTCRATINGKLLEVSATLKIFRPLSFSSCKEEQQPIIYKDAKIRCTASGDPAPKVQWNYKGRQIHTVGRYEVVPDGLIIKNITEADNGAYSLEAEIVAKSSYEEREILVKVVVPPKISKPPIMSRPVEGSEFTLDCDASGNPNPTYNWYKDGKDLDNNRIKIDKVDGILKVKNVKRSDSGKYRCVAHNIGGNATAVTDVTVLVPPKVEVVKYKTGKEGTKISIVCKGKGIPEPSLTWQKSNDAPFPIGSEFNGVLVEKSSSEQETVLTLTISSLDADDADNYTCIGHNDVGKDEERIYLTVHYKPIFVNTPAVAYNWMGNKANITCTAKSLPKSSVTWLANGNEIGNSDTYKIFKTEGQEQMTSFLQVSVTPSNEKTVFTEYTCKAVNILDTATKKITLKKAVVPKSPAKVDPVTSTPTTVTVLISAPVDDGGIPVNQYHITYVGSGKKQELDVTVTEEEAKKPKKIVIEDLTPKTKYQIKVFAGNNVGLSTTSINLSAETPGIRAPFDVLIQSSRYGTDPTSYRVVWSEPRTGGAEIVSYSIQYRMVNIIQSKDPWEVDSNAKSGKYNTETVQGKTSTVIKELAANTYYEIQVIATNKVGSSGARPIIILTKKIETSAAEPPMAAASTGITSGGVAGLIIALIIIIIIILDLICYFKFKKGAIYFLVHNVCKPAASVKDKSTDAEAGASQETTLLTDKQQKEEVEQAGEENKEAATDEGVTVGDKLLKKDDTEDDLKKDQTDKINTEEKSEEILSKNPEA